MSSERGIRGTKKRKSFMSRWWSSEPLRWVWGAVYAPKAQKYPYGCGPREKARRMRQVDHARIVLRDRAK